MGLVLLKIILYRPVCSTCAILCLGQQSECALSSGGFHSVQASRAEFGPSRHSVVLWEVPAEGGHLWIYCQRELTEGYSKRGMPAGLKGFTLISVPSPIGLHHFMQQVQQHRKARNLWEAISYCLSGILSRSVIVLLDVQKRQCTRICSGRCQKRYCSPPFVVC